MSLTAIILVQLPLALVVNRLLSRLGRDPQQETAQALASITAKLEENGYRVQGTVIAKKRVVLAYVAPDGEEGLVDIRRRRDGRLVLPLPR